jgi:multiple sugar transport system permease protein
MNSDGGTMLNSYWALILVNTAFQTGFCHLRAEQLHEDAAQGALRVGNGGRRVGAAPVFQLTLPLCRPPLAALATLEVTWIYNEVLLGDRAVADRRQVPPSPAL